MPGSSISARVTPETLMSPMGRGICEQASRQAPSLRPEASVRSALVLLDQHAADALAIVDPVSGVPLGILTLRDVLRRIVLGGGEMDLPVAAVMTGGVITLPVTASIHQASVLMIRRNVRHVILIDAAGRYQNIVSQEELYARPGARSGALVASIAQAPDIASLAAVAVDVRAFSRQLLAQGLSADALCQQISALNDLISLRAIDLVSAKHELPYVPWCWVVFGSEGRLEQTLSTDQDNGLVFVAENKEEAESLRRIFLPFAQEVNAALDACGFPLCKGNIMASNPELCLSLTEWKAEFQDWLLVAEPHAVLNASIYFDLRALYGEEHLVKELQDWLLERVPECSSFLRAMVETTLNWPSPLAWWSGFRYDDNKSLPHTIDLKAHGVRPFVDAARIWALAKGVAATNTAERLRIVGPLLNQRPEETATYLAALDQVQRIRFATQMQAELPAHANRINPDSLNELDRQILKEAFKLVKRLQQMLQIQYLRS